MTELNRAFCALRRPKLLIRAARLGLEHYVRDRDLRRIARTGRLPSPERALAALMEEEEKLESTRKLGDATYSACRHVELLVAIMAEARLLPRPRGDARA
ncbi:hypothetical protein DDZ14_06720 [Maritimibacter sp. 55A14]|uniref:DUF6477 family protein n=1 Tax=Maritimibacter sp. 55A14 TaxID=2174844 RepID=UPI000D612A78|nr:DUF6477 family protein [Maritimibacter sp. 55A14]PWE33104.1 hypothetical protein DDZ14_06720 [Maritimibacter sp. 55A14]